MNAPSTTPAPAPAPAPERAARLEAARQALAACAGVEQVSAEAAALVETDDHRLFALLEAREQMLLDLAEHLAVLQHGPRHADDPRFAATEAAVDEVDQAFALVVSALEHAERTTASLALRVANRIESIRTELAQLQRASVVGHAYQSGVGRAVDLRR